MPLWGDGHGPAFGYSTTTLGVHDSSVETSVMWRLGSAMTGSKFSYGWKENLQFSVSTTFHLNPGEHPVGESYEIGNTDSKPSSPVELTFDARQ